MSGYKLDDAGWNPKNPHPQCTCLYGPDCARCAWEIADASAEWRRLYGPKKGPADDQ